MGDFQRTRGVGIYVCTGGFTNAAERKARTRSAGGYLLNLENLFDLWMQYYERVSSAINSCFRSDPCTTWRMRSRFNSRAESFISQFASLPVADVPMWPERTLVTPQTELTPDSHPNVWEQRVGMSFVALLAFAAPPFEFSSGHFLCWPLDVVVDLQFPLKLSELRAANSCPRSEKRAPSTRCVHSQAGSAGLATCGAPNSTSAT